MSISTCYKKSSEIKKFYEGKKYSNNNDDASGSNNQLYDIFTSTFFKKIGREEELPIERAIASICSLIQNNQVVVDGFERYSLKLK